MIAAEPERQMQDTKRSWMLLLSSCEAGVGLDEASCMNPVVKTIGLVI